LISNEIIPTLIISNCFNVPSVVVVVVVAADDGGKIPNHLLSYS